MTKSYLKDLEQVSKVLQTNGRPAYFVSNGENALFSNGEKKYGIRQNILRDFGQPRDENTLGSITGADVWLNMPKLSQMGSSYPSKVASYYKALD